MKNDGHQVVTLGALDLFEGLDIFMFGAVHDRKDFDGKVILGPAP